MLRAGRRGLLARLGVQSHQLWWNGFMSQRSVSVFNGIGNGLQSSQSHSPFIFTNGLIGGPLEHVFSHNLRAFATETSIGSDYSTDPVVAGLARDAAMSEIARTDLKKVLKNYYKLDDTKVIREAQRLIDVHKEITHAQGSWKDVVEIWFNKDNEPKFTDENDLKFDIENNGKMTTIGANRQALIDHLLDTARKFESLPQDKSPYSFLVSGIAGIGKSTAQTEVGQRIPDLYPSVAVARFNIGKWRASMEWPEIDLTLLPYVREISGKENVLIFVDDSDAVFRVDGTYANSFCASLNGLVETDIPHVAVEIFGSSQVLNQLVRGTMDEDIARKHKFFGFLKGCPAVNGGKLLAFTPNSPQNRRDVTILGDHMVKQYHGHRSDALFLEDDVQVCSWFFGGVARNMEKYLRGRSRYSLLRDIWSSLSYETKDFYFTFATKNGMTGSIKSWNDCVDFMQSKDAFNWLNECNKTKDMRKYILDPQTTDLLVRGAIQELADLSLRPTIPVCVLLACILKHEFWKDQLFIESLIAPLVSKDDILLGLNTMHKQGTNRDYLQKLRIMKTEFSNMCVLPSKNQADLALHLSPNGLNVPSVVDGFSDAEHNPRVIGKYHGVLAVDILNFGAINTAITPREADLVIADFGLQYLSLCKEYHNSDKLAYCNVYHRNGDEFQFICVFNELEHFEEFVNKVAEVEIGRQDPRNNNYIPCYGRIGAYYCASNESIDDGYNIAQKIEQGFKKEIIEKLAPDMSPEQYMMKIKDGYPVPPIKDKTMLFRISNVPPPSYQREKEEEETDNILSIE